MRRTEKRMRANRVAAEDVVSYLETIRKAACRLELDPFLLRYEGVYLLGNENEEPSPGEDRWSFSTQAVDGMSDRLLRAIASGSRDLTAGRFLCRLEKSDRNPFKGAITVGRAANNDVVIRHPLVSKVHAQFEARRGEPRADDLMLLDIGSSNGTRVNGKLLIRDEPVRVRVSDTCTFGKVDCEVHDGASLHRRIRLLFPTDELVSSGR